MFDHASLINRVLESKWAITPTALEQIIRVVSDDYNPADLAKAMHGIDLQKVMTDEGKFDFSAISAKDDDHLTNTRRATIRDGVAIVPVIGPIFPRSNIMTVLSGATAISTLAKDFQVALDSDSVHTIILNMDTPGGEITGVSEFAQMVYSARAKKDIVTYVYGWGASAGYWIGSASKEIVVADTAEVGSIGVVAGYVDDREAMKKRGLEEIEIVSSQSPNKRLDPKTAEGRDQIQTTVDQLAGVFISAVTKHRGIQEDEVLQNFGRGGMVVASRAVQLGMADKIGGLEGIISEQIELHKSTISQGGIYMPMTLEELRAKEPEAYKAAVEVGKKEAEASSSDKIAQARDEGAKAENERLKSIEDLRVPGAEEVIAENKFDMSITAEKMSMKIIKFQEEQRSAMDKNRSVEGKNLASAVHGVGDQETDNSAGEEEAAIVKAGVSKVNQSRERRQ